MDLSFIGELAAVATSIGFSIAPTFFTLAGRQVGSVVVNRARIGLAAVIVVIVHWALLGIPLPLEAEGFRWGWLGLSGLIGFTLGDAALFQAFVMIGARITMLVFALSPVISSILAWVFLNESLSGPQILGMAVTLGGVAWVVAERENGDGVDALGKREYWLGLLAAFGGAVGQAVGVITARLGLEGDFSTLSALVIRLLGGAVSLWLITVIQRKARVTFRRLRENPLATRQIFLATLAGPFAGVYFSLVAIQNTSIGIASTLMSLPPIFLLPIGYFVFKERVSPRAILGTAVALAGVAVLFLV